MNLIRLGEIYLAVSNVSITKVNIGDDTLPEENLPRQLTVTKQQLVNFIKNVT